MLATELAALADAQARTIKSVANEHSCDAATVAEAERIANDHMAAIWRRVRKYNERVDATCANTPHCEVESNCHADADAPLQTRSEVPPTKRRTGTTQCRVKIFGYSATAVLRWMGANGWNFEDAAVAMATLGAHALADCTIRLQLKAGKDGARGPAAPITPAQAKQLRRASV